MSYLAGIEVDRIQETIFQSDKLKEMIGTSWLIEESRAFIERRLKVFTGIQLVWPVSGVFKLKSDDLETLGSCLWEIVVHFTRQLGLSVTVGVVQMNSGMSYGQAWQALDREIRKAKDAKQGEDGTPGLPYFSSCRILPTRFANTWDPTRQEDEQNRRRALISREALMLAPKREGLPFLRLDVFNSFKRKSPHDLDDLTVAGAADSYIAFVKADGDGLGKLLAVLDWEKAKWENAPLRPWEKASAFAQALDSVFRDSLEGAVCEVLQKAKLGERFPLAPILVGGEDLWLLCRRDLALLLVKHCGEIFAKKTASDPILAGALDSSGIQEPLSLSFGVLFAQKGYPFDNQADIVNELIKNAKAYRRERLSQEAKEGCLDFHWLEGTGRELVRTYRESSFGYSDKGKNFWLFSRPWTISELGLMLEAIKSLAGIPRRKLHQLRQILSAGHSVSCAMAHQWWLRLDERQRRAWESAVNLIPQRIRPRDLKIFLDEQTRLDPGFWIVPDGRPNDRISSILELLELVEISECPDRAGHGREGNDGLDEHQV